MFLVIKISIHALFYFFLKRETYNFTCGLFRGKALSDESNGCFSMLSAAGLMEVYVIRLYLFNLLLAGGKAKLFFS